MAQSLVQSRWIPVAAQQLSAALTQLAIREAGRRYPREADAPAPATRDDGRDLSNTRSTKTGLGALVIALVGVGVWSAWSLVMMSRWLATGRGPGERIVAASAVSPRHYRFRPRA